MMKNLLKLIDEYKTTRNKKAYLFVILEMSGEIQFPKYSLIQLLNSNSNTPNEIISSEGWIETDVDSKLTKLQKEREKIEKEKINLKKARLDFEKTINEERAKAKQIVSLKNKDNLNIKNRNTLKKTSKDNNRKSLPQKKSNDKRTSNLGIFRIEFKESLEGERGETEQIIDNHGFEDSNTTSVNTKEQITINNQFNHEAIQVALKILIIGLLALLISFSQLIGFGLILSIITLTKYRKWTKIYKKVIPSSILKSYLNGGRICAYISLVIVIIKIINTNIESFK